jgi:hypothetical protein
MASELRSGIEDVVYASLDWDESPWSGANAKTKSALATYGKGSVHNGSVLFSHFLTFLTRGGEAT